MSTTKVSDQKKRKREPSVLSTEKQKNRPISIDKLSSNLALKRKSLSSYSKGSSKTARVEGSKWKPVRQKFDNN